MSFLRFIEKKSMVRCLVVRIQSCLLLSFSALKIYCVPTKQGLKELVDGSICSLTRLDEPPASRSIRCCLLSRWQQARGADPRGDPTSYQWGWGKFFLAGDSGWGSEIVADGVKT